MHRHEAELRFAAARELHGVAALCHRHRYFADRELRSACSGIIARMSCRAYEALHRKWTWQVYHPAVGHVDNGDNPTVDLFWKMTEHRMSGKPPRIIPMIAR